MFDLSIPLAQGPRRSLSPSSIGSTSSTYQPAVPTVTVLDQLKVFDLKGLSGGNSTYSNYLPVAYLLLFSIVGLSIYFALKKRKEQMEKNELLQSTVKRNEKMKSWKIPGLILPLLYFGGYLGFRANWGIGTTLYIGDFAYNTNGILGNLWIGIIAAIGIWLVLVFPWKSVYQKCVAKLKMRLNRKAFIGFGALVAISLIIGVTVSSVSAKAEAKARVADQIHQQEVKDAEDAELQAEQDRDAAESQRIAEAEAEAETEQYQNQYGTSEEDTASANTDQYAVSRTPSSNQYVTHPNSLSKSTSATDNLSLVIPEPSIPTPSVSNITTSGNVGSKIDGTFNGWGGDTTFKLRNGQEWKQSSFDYKYHYADSPDVEIYKSGSGYKMKVDGVDKTIDVTRIK